MTRTARRSGSILIVTAAALVAAACGGSQDSGQASPSPSASTVSPSQMTDQQRPTDRLTIDVSIEGGNVTPTNARLEGKVGQPIVLRVNSDAADELHVHSVPDHTFTVEPKPGQQFQFTVDVPGNVEIELHDLHRVIASVQVQP
ncbi:hypothetical protein [Mycolicibacterium litorale]|uniref:EfeO-type cupredoxin-like domain-containing protein n=1 Tax=Mycolicibacterium litorale TaxID=758802 RepID=A0AAD1IPT9_9MYCO|nr:hypothetical protein [Mycolicibacterium litorale]MCV7417647.1 hypothetical protein [Mycolicibacterium litorale]TDY06966.1 hypothetical protein BCL50_3307 [Mycolicibacterium litorale]BBY18876.1 hypothetical protein MLIT_44680 [Mycolicibacterium litorale]